MREVCEGNVEGGYFPGPWRICKGRLWRRASLSIGAPLGTWKGACISLRELYDGNLEGGLLYWGP